MDTTDLIRALKDEAWNIRKDAAMTLGCIGDPQAIPALIELLQKKNRDGYARREAAIALGRIGSLSTLPELIAALKDTDSEVRRGAAEALGQIGDLSTVPELITALNDEKQYVRDATSKALGQIGQPAVPRLLEALPNQSIEGRKEIIRLLGSIGANESIPALLELLSLEDISVRVVVAKALTKLDSAKVIPSLLEILPGFFADDSWAVREDATTVLGDIALRYPTPELLNFIPRLHQLQKYSFLSGNRGRDIYQETLERIEKAAIGRTDFPIFSIEPERTSWFKRLLWLLRGTQESIP